MNPKLTHIPKDEPGVYKICVYGRLDKSWSNRLSGLAIHTVENSNYIEETVLTGELVDQAALFGVLNTLYSLGYTLLFVERVPSMDTIPQTHSPNQ